MRIRLGWEAVIIGVMMLVTVIGAGQGGLDITTVLLVVGGFLLLWFGLINATGVGRLRY